MVAALCCRSFAQLALESIDNFAVAQRPGWQGGPLALGGDTLSLAMPLAELELVSETRALTHAILARNSPEREVR